MDTAKGLFCNERNVSNIFSRPVIMTVAATRQDLKSKSLDTVTSLICD
jgi:hypothetical protein